MDIIRGIFSLHQSMTHDKQRNNKKNKVTINFFPQKLGHEVVPYTPDCIVEGVDIFMELMMADQGSLAYSMLKGETTDAGLAWYKQCAAVPPHVRQVAKPLIRRQFGDFATEHSLCTYIFLILLESFICSECKMIAKFVFVKLMVNVRCTQYMSYQSTHILTPIILTLSHPPITMLI